MNILIVQTKKTALKVAAAYNGLKQGDYLTLSSKDILNDTNGAMSNVRGEKFSTNINGEETIVMWSSDAHINFARPPLLENDALPYLTETEYTISPRWKDALDSVIAEGGVKKIIVALLPTMRTALFHYLLPSAYPNVTVLLTRFDSLEAADIRRALKNASYDKAEAKKSFDNALARKHITDLVRANITSAMRNYKGIKGGVDQYILTTLFLINNRTQNKGRDKYRIRANFQLNGQPCCADSDACFTIEKAQEAMQTLAGKPLAGATRVKPSLPTTATLFSLYDGEEYMVSEMQRVAISLYEKGFITCPYTMNRRLPPGTDDKRIEQLREVCKSYDSAIGESFELAKHNITTEQNDAIPGCILPLKTDTTELTVREESLYDHLVRSVTTNFNELGTNVYYRFKVDGSPLTFMANTKAMTLGRAGKMIECNYEMVQDGKFEIYRVGELMDELTSYGFGTAEMLMTLLDRLGTLGFIVTSTMGVSVSEQGMEYCKQYPLEAFRSPDLCVYWDWALRANREQTASPDVILDKVKGMIRGWIEVFKGNPEAENRNAMPKIPAAQKNAAPDEAATEPEHPKKEAVQKPAEQKPVNEPAPAPKKEDATQPPFSEQPKSAPLPSTIEDEGLTYELTDDDFNALRRKGYIGPKFGKTKDKKVTGAKYIYLDKDGQISASDKTVYKCPFCGNEVNVFAWGYACSTCKFYVPFYLYGKVLNPDDIKTLMRGEKTGMIDSMKLKDGTEFSARLSIDADGKVHLYRK